MKSIQRLPTLDQLRHRLQTDKELLKKHPENRDLLERRIARHEHEIAAMPGKIFVQEVMDLARKYGVNCFIVTDGASGIINNGNDAVRHARLAHMEWEKLNGIDPLHDWASK